MSTVRNTDAIQEVNYGKLLNDYLDKHNGIEPDEDTKKYLKSLSYKTNRISKLYNKAWQGKAHSYLL